MKLTCLSAIIACTLLFSCKKDDAPSPLAGSWSGKLSKGTEAPPVGSFYMKLGSDHSLKRLESDGDIAATGTWKVTGDQFTAQYKYLDDPTIVVFLTGTYDSKTNAITGSWENSYEVKGLWNAQKGK
ncbi:hypothetical protein MKQ68_14415 [Chitinophaga horti]|uniref:Lipocalin-like domain-containing protein n=1 Tax=Chitinophaga horti TaxID=2920382 RepID=A0ABY6IV84_9BACT|nr:hypothetical protein [Chitinophaga horti]UYQ91283.1 hypothetical protein MKQ68_14415 [Chitinophaga horti]